jgi:uncharacterized membrane protein
MPYDDSEPVHPLIVLVVIASLCALAYFEIARPTTADRAPSCSTIKTQGGSK